MADDVTILGPDANLALEPVHWFDGPPFSSVPAWLDFEYRMGRLQPHNRGGTDYAQWLVTTATGARVNAWPGDVLRNAGTGTEVIQTPENIKRNEDRDASLSRLGLTPFLDQFASRPLPPGGDVK